MSREIKFRGWVERDGILLGPRIYTLEEIRLLEDQDPGTSTTIVMWDQYTGLKDKNGKEIYEGDIIKARDWDGDWGKYRIKWKQSHCAFEAFEYRKSRAWNWTLKGFVDIEVIDNIHENPELLGGEE